MKPWAIDAREAIKDVEAVAEIDDNLIELTDEIKEFIKENKYFLIATKGFGKSLLLMYKRKTLKNIHLIPKHEPLDVLTVGLLPKEAFRRLYDKNEFQEMWALSITIAVVKRLGIIKNKEDFSKSLQKIIDNPLYNSVSSVFNVIITDINRKEFIDELSSDYRKVLIPALTSIKIPIAVFIDNVDECFEDYREIWYIAQHCLMKTIYDIVRTNSKIKIFASIRKEAYLKYGTEMSLQYKGVSLNLSYSKEELKEIFIRNIKKEDPDKLIDRSSIASNPIKAFIGIDKIHHGFVDEEENMFDYIYRHTLQRPRDFMEIGGEISRCKPVSRDPRTPEGIEIVKLLVNRAAESIARQYLKEVIPHLTITEEEINNALALITSNILKANELKKICIEFNGNDAKCVTANCKECLGKKHIFCELYKIGLLGYIEHKKTEKNEYIQKFEMVGSKIFDEVRLLPESPYYLIHPILDELIREKNVLYKQQINTINIVGYDRPWSKKRINYPSKKELSLVESVKEIIQRKVELKKRFSKEATFLDVDVVSSTKLKEQEEDTDIIYSFDQYHTYIKEKVEAFKGRVLDSVGDEVMAMFDTPDDAIKAGIEIFKGRDEFNNKRNELKKDFQFRIGINTGVALVDKDKAYSNVLDIAGHLQKEANPGEILISEKTYNAISEKDKYSFSKIYIEKDEIWAYTYIPISSDPISSFRGKSRKGNLTISLLKARQEDRKLEEKLNGRHR